MGSASLRGWAFAGAAAASLAFLAGGGGTDPAFPTGDGPGGGDAPGAHVVRAATPPAMAAAHLHAAPSAVEEVEPEGPTLEILVNRRVVLGDGTREDLPVPDAEVEVTESDGQVVRL